MPNKYKLYFTFRQWSATGEGLTYQFMVCGSKTPDGAKKKHIEEFIPIFEDLGEIDLPKADLDYLKSQVITYPLRTNGKLNKKVIAILNDFLNPSMIDYVASMVEQKGLMALKFETYSNLS
jgi:hypothetical protein